MALTASAVAPLVVVATMFHVFFSYAAHHPAPLCVLRELVDVNCPKSPVVLGRVAAVLPAD
jgi:hypothetical protein